MKCKNCGTEIDEGKKFCPECGAEAEDSTEVAEVIPEILDESSTVTDYYGSGGVKPKMEPKRLNFIITTGCYALIFILIMFADWFVLAKGWFLPSIHFPLFIFNGAADAAGISSGHWIVVTILFIILSAGFTAFGATYVIKRLRHGAHYRRWGVFGMICAVVIFLLVIITTIIGGAGINAVSPYKLQVSLTSYILLVLAVAGIVAVRKS